MNAVWASASRACAVILLALLMSACALPQRGAFSGTKVDFNAYPVSRVGLLPIVINSQYPSDLPVSGVQEAVIQALSTSLDLRPAVLARDQAVATEAAFPLTPQRLSALAEQYDWDGLVGVSIASWSTTSRSDGRERVHVDLMISYADHRTPRGQWTVTGTWSAGTTSRLPLKIASGLPAILMDMRRGLTAISLSALFLERSGDQPQLTYIAPDEESQVLAPERVTSRKYVDLHLTSIDDRGLLDMEVTNDSNEFRWALRGAKNDKGDYPIFLASRVRVPLAHAENKIVLKARSAASSRSETRRDFSITSTGRHEFFALPIGVDDYKYLGAVRGSASGARALAAAARVHSATPFAELTDDQVTLDAIDGLLRVAADRLSVGDTVLLSFAGRAVPLGSAVFIALPDIESSKPSGSFLRAEDLIRSGSSREMILSLDLCAEADELPWVRRYLQAAIPQDQSALVRLAECTVPLGGLARAAANALEYQDRMSTNRYRGSQFFGDFVRLVRSGQVAAPAGTAWTDIVFAGDGSLPDLVTTGWVPNQKGQGFLGSLLRLAPPPPVEPQPTPEPAEFYVIAYSTASEDEARREAHKRGPTASVVEGAAGFFGVAVRQAKDAKSANEGLQDALRKGEVSSDAYVLPRSRIARVLP